MSTFTNPDLIPKPAPGDVVANLEDWFGGQADAMQAALLGVDITTAVLNTITAGWTVAGTRIWKSGGFVYVSFNGIRSTALAAGASEVVGVIPTGFRPADGQYLASGCAFGSTTPATIPVQISGSGALTVFNQAGTHLNFTATMAHKAA